MFCHKKNSFLAILVDMWKILVYTVPRWWKQFWVSITPENEAAFLTPYNKCHPMATNTPWQLTPHDNCHPMTTKTLWQLKPYDNCHLVTTVTRWQLTPYDNWHLMTADTLWPLSPYNNRCRATNLAHTSRAIEWSNGRSHNTDLISMLAAGETRTADFLS